MEAIITLVGILGVEMYGLLMASIVPKLSSLHWDEMSLEGDWQEEI